VALAAVSGVIAQNPTEGFDVFTQPDPNSPGASISAGSNYNIKWNPTKPTGPISIYLLQGSSNRTLMLGDAVASTCTPLASCGSRRKLTCKQRASTAPRAAINGRSPLSWPPSLPPTVSSFNWTPTRPSSSTQPTSASPAFPSLAPAAQAPPPSPSK
jgi:hypothetical protein